MDAETVHPVYRAFPERPDNRTDDERADDRTKEVREVRQNELATMRRIIAR